MAVRHRRSPRTLVIDVGGSHIKAARLDARGQLIGEREKVKTPNDLDRTSLVKLCVELARRCDGFERISVGINGIVHRGVVYSIPVTRHESFRAFPLAARLEQRLERPARLINDAEMHGLGVIRGRGVELVLTLGTGLGSALFIQGELGPRLQLLPSARDDAIKGGDYGDAALKRLGRKRWNTRVQRLIETVRIITNFDRLYLGGGNADKLRLRLPRDVMLCDNMAALVGGVRLWEWDVRE